MNKIKTDEEARKLIDPEGQRTNLYLDIRIGWTSRTGLHFQSISVTRYKVQKVSPAG